jgi:hypothetical protein
MQSDLDPTARKQLKQVDTVRDGFEYRLRHGGVPLEPVEMQRRPTPPTAPSVPLSLALLIGPLQNPGTCHELLSSAPG